jgi:hypothetical protein
VKQRLVQIGVVVALVAAAVLLRNRDRLPQTPEEAVSAFFDAAGKGDAAAYLRLATGELAKSLGETRAQLGAEGFRSSIQASVKGVKGFAVARSANAPPERVALEVDIVFSDRNERQRMLCAPQGNGWLISAIEAARMVKPAIPYGTPVYEEPPPAAAAKAP